VGTQLAALDSRVTFRRHAKNQGHIQTYNEGLLGWAESEYSLLLSADDVLAPGALQRAVRLMEAHADPGMTYGRGIRTTDPSSELPPAAEGRGTTALPGDEFIRLTCEEAGNLVPTPTAVVRTKIQQQVGGYRPDLPHTGDMEMWLRFAARGPIGVIDCVQAYHRAHPTNMSVGYRGVSDLRARKAAFDALFDEPAAVLRNYPNMRSAAYRGLAGQACRKASAVFKAGGTAAEIQDYLHLAVELYPDIRRHRLYLRVRCEVMLGATLSRAMGSALNTLQRVRRSGGGRQGSDWLRSPYVAGRVPLRP
jgi:hypothetical protein